jgi:hypothetical protein
MLSSTEDKTCAKPVARFVPKSKVEAAPFETSLASSVVIRKARMRGKKTAGPEGACNTPGPDLMQRTSF